jgi:FMN phosphatase YigB (HAD superfamily)
MVSAVVLDYNSTIPQPRGNDYTELMKRLMKNSDLKSEEEAAEWLEKGFLEFTSGASGDSYLTYSQIITRLLTKAEEELHLKDNRDQLVVLIRNSMIYAPVYDDVKVFFSHIKLPIYILSIGNANCSRVSMRRNYLHPHGFIACETVRCYPPEKAVYKKIEEVTGYKKEDILLVSGSLGMAVKGAIDYGMQAVLLDRDSRYRNTDVLRARSLVEVAAHLEAE